MDPGGGCDGKQPQTFFGRVKSYNYARGFGFLESPSVDAIYGRDVFMRKEACEELTLSRIASGSGPEAAVDRGDIFVRFVLKLNEAGKPEAEDVIEAKASDVPEDLLQLPALPKLGGGKAAGYSKGPSESQGKSLDAKDCRAAASKGSKKLQDKELRAQNVSKEMKGSSRSKVPTMVGDYRVLVGQDAAENWNLLAAAKKKHWFFHLTDYSSCYVILECTGEPSEEEKQQCAQICREHSQHKLSGPTKVDATQCGNVKFDRKRDAVGECEYKDETKVEIFTVE